MTGLFASIEAMVPALRRYAVAMLSDQGEADEVVQACLADAVGRLRAPRNEAELRARLFAYVYRQLTTRLRPRRPRCPSASARTPRGPTTSTELTGALGQLPLEQRSVIFLISVEDLSYAAVAKVMGMPITAVMSLLAAGRERLRQSMGGSGTSGSPGRVP
jgi:RNA polymerase sigma-70 factor (ECF subfamily)